MDFILEGITVNGIPLKDHIREASVPEIRKVIKENIYKPLGHRGRVKYHTRAERPGKVKIYTPEEISKIMGPISKPSLPTHIRNLLYVRQEAGVTSTYIYDSYKEIDPTVTKKKVFQTISTLANRFGLTKTQNGKERIYSLPQSQSEPKLLEAKEGFLPQVVRVEGKVDINININWR